MTFILHLTHEARVVFQIDFWVQIEFKSNTNNIIGFRMMISVKGYPWQL